MSILTDAFERIYVINLLRRKDRRRAIRRELRALGLDFTHSAVRLFPATQCSEACGFPSPAVRGCFMSHLATLREARDNKLRNVLIMEDDLFISPRFLPALPSIVRQLDALDWGFLYLGHVEKSPALEGLVRTDMPLGTSHFYAVNGAAFDPLIHYLEEVLARPAGHPQGGPMHYDGALCMFRERNPAIQTYMVHPSLGGQRPSRSDIHSRWFDRLVGLRQAAHIARCLRENLSNRSASAPSAVRPEAVQPKRS